MATSAFTSTRRLSSTPAIHELSFTGRKVGIQELSDMSIRLRGAWDRVNARFNRTFTCVPDDDEDDPELRRFNGSPARVVSRGSMPPYVPTVPQYEPTRKRARHDSPVVCDTVSVDQRIAASLARAQHAGKVVNLCASPFEI